MRLKKAWQFNHEPDLSLFAQDTNAGRSAHLMSGESQEITVHVPDIYLLMRYALSAVYDGCYAVLQPLEKLGGSVSTPFCAETLR